LFCSNCHEDSLPHHHANISQRPGAIRRHGNCVTKKIDDATMAMHSLKTTNQFAVSTSTANWWRRKTLRFMSQTKKY